jgi:tRNA/rRNA methyltransferase
MTKNLKALAIVLVRTRNPLNIGAVARAMQNFGAIDLRLVMPYEASFREARSAVGAGAVLRDAREFESVADAVADCRLVMGTTAARGRELAQPLMELEQAAAPAHAALAEKRVALLFGSEKHGLTREDMDHCHSLIRIPTDEAQPSMNLGQAVAVCLWELARDTGSAVLTAEPVGTEPVATGEHAPSADLERLGALVMELLEVGGYARSERQGGTAAEVRQMLRRMCINDADARLLMGMMRKVLWKLRFGDESRGATGDDL